MFDQATARIAAARDDGLRWLLALRTAETVATVVAIAGAVLLVLLFKIAFHALDAAGPYGPLWAVAVAFGVALACLKLSWAQFAAPTRLLLKAMALVLGAYGLAADFSWPAGESAAADRIILVAHGVRVAAAAAAVAALWRPSFVIIPAVYILAYKAIITRLFGIEVTITDYMPLIELTLFMVFAYLLRWLTPALAKRTLNVERFSAYVFVGAVSTHFANYVYSALTKVQIGVFYSEAGPFHWIYGNNTAWLTAGMSEAGYVPLSAAPWLLSFGLLAMTVVMPAMNAMTFIGQLAPLAAIARRGSIIAVTLFFDLTHVVIGMVSGIFFWKWILLNLFIVAAARRLPSLSSLPAAFPIGMVMIMVAPLVFFVARLGWYDTPAYVDSYVVAVGRDGREHRVPSNYFGAMSVTVAQQRLGRPPGHFPTKTFGSTARFEDWKAAENNCTFPQPGEARGEIEKMPEFVARHHRYVLTRLDESGHFNYDLYPHHIFSNPALFTDFARLDKRSIDHYLYVVQSKCISYDDGKVVADVRKEDRIRIDVGT